MRSGKSPSIAPMKTNYLNRRVLQLTQRGIGALLCGVCVLSFALVVAHSQVKQKHITAMQLGESSEGARVTVVSDSSLNDYEAYRSGSRFYVKIPVADLNFVPARLRADGFDDVQVQRAGDGVLVSFKLQPGATARVEPFGNRLEIIFSTPNRIARKRSTQSSTGSSTAPGVATTGRGSDAAGPVPPSTENASRERFATPVLDQNAISGSLNSRRRHLQRRNSTRGQQSSAIAEANEHNAGALPSPSASPFVAPTPQNSTYSPVNAGTPGTVVGANPSTGSNVNAAGVSPWRARASKAIAWVKANRLATLVAALIVLSLIYYLFTALRRPRTDAVKTKQAKTPKVQPKLSTEELKERPQQEKVGPAPVVNATENRQPSTAAAASSIDKSTFSRPSFSGPTIEPESTEEQEREVFEL